MGEYAGLSTREVHALYDRSVTRIYRAGWISVISTTLQLLSLITFGVDNGQWGALLPLIVTASLNYLLAYEIFQRKQWPAIALLLNFVIGATLRALQLDSYAGLVISALFAYPLALGALGAIDYAELLKDHEALVPDTAV